MGSIKYYLVIYLIFFCQSLLLSQVSDLSEKDFNTKEHKKTIYYLMQRAWIANQEPSYASILPFVPSIKERRVPLRQGEGENSDFSLLEANFNLSYPLFFGREKSYLRKKKDSTGKRLETSFFQRNRITFDYNGNFRMSLDNSKPIFPGSNKVGISWYWNLYNRQTGYITKDNRKNSDITENNINFVNLLLRAHHYSNGQPEGEFYYIEETISNEKRNNYRNGDFSTNYFYGELTYGWYNDKLTTLTQWSLGYRRDFGSTGDGAIAFSKEQVKTYGKNRILFSFDHRTSKLSNKMQFHFRVQSEYIAGNLDDFSSNLLNSDNTTDTGKYRFNIKGLFELAPDNHRTVGYFVSVFYGRDYLNIRYDDIIYSTQLGITLSLDKFFMPELN